uniref:NFAM1 Ig-like domain-containing protein n=1 Tax=Canis lupus dingo TaxID=286419 RepID=A0A8C0JIH2_CANLU
MHERCECELRASEGSRRASSILEGKLPLFPFPSPAGGQSVTHSGDPILVSLANKAVSFNCKITYSYTPEFKDFTVWYFHVDLKSQRSLNKQVNCPPTQGKENQTYTLQCQVTLKLPNASATGTYYCCVNWPKVHRISDWRLHSGQRHRVPRTSTELPEAPAPLLHWPPDCAEHPGHSSAALEEETDAGSPGAPRPEGPSPERRRPPGAASGGVRLHSPTA